jgi:hypothetical protein
MAQVRYLGFSVGNVQLDDRSDDALGRFVALGEPMPVGTEIELDGVAMRITRVDESAHGFWARPLAAGAMPLAVPATPLAVPATPQPIESEATVPTASPAQMTPEPADAADEGASEPAGDGVPEPVAEAAPEPTPEESGGSRKGRRRRGRKTVLGR